MPEQVIIVRSHDDGEPYCVVTPSDPLNPQFTVDEIKQRMPDAIVETFSVSTLTDFITYDDEMIGESMRDVPPSGGGSIKV